MRKPSSSSQIRIGMDCDREVVAMLGVLVRSAGWETLLEALQSVATGSGQPRIGGTILAAREWLYGREEGDAKAGRI